MKRHNEHDAYRFHGIQVKPATSVRALGSILSHSHIPIRSRPLHQVCAHAARQRGNTMSISRNERNVYAGKCSNSAHNV